jgi:hypothetical protein
MCVLLHEHEAFPGRDAEDRQDGSAQSSAATMRDEARETIASDRMTAADTRRPRC